MHGVRSVKGKAKSAEQFRLECVYADASLSLPFSHSRLFGLSYRYSHSYYFSSVLVTIGTPETKESFERGKDKSREWLRGRNGEQEEGDIERERRKNDRATWVAGCVGVARGAVRVLSPGESAEVGVEKRGKGLGN